MPSQHHLGTLRGVPNSEGRNRVQPHQCFQHITVIAAYGPTLLEARDAGISSIAVSALGVVLRTAEDAPTGRAYWGRSLECR